ncbi:hypothetical protein GP2143_16061 [marine gamma proteobacterium HTCC2143]|uniref:Glycosyltransferase 61 catalytic domain-containing protein n=1 Tax=marine gamma proteobacterium HTCC2143 TaxID=247633 RepID=A0Y9I2_9GAMM|nr:hypothetical protein GP2143_16061 [marine gamma proteobacterium HTCC2143]
MSKKWKKFGSVASKTRQPTAREKPASRIERLAKSQFDIEYYREQYQITGLDTDVDYYSHYLDSGDKANFCPYRGFNPLYIRHGQNNWDYSKTALEILLDGGVKSDRPDNDADRDTMEIFSFLAVTKDWFDISVVENYCERIYTSTGEAISVYMHHMMPLFLAPNKWFFPSGYSAMNLDLFKATVNPISHYILHGIHEYRSIPARLNDERLNFSFFQFTDLMPEFHVDPTQYRITSEFVEKLEPLDSQDEISPGVSLIHHSGKYLLGGTRCVFSDSGGKVTHYFLEYLNSMNVKNVTFKTSSIEKIDAKNIAVDVSVPKDVSFKKAVNLMNEYDRNYFHFAVEVCSILYFLEAQNISSDYVLLLSDDLHPNFFELFDIIVKDTPYSYVKLSRGILARVGDLIEVSGHAQILDIYETRPNDEDIFISEEAIRYVRNKVLKELNINPVASNSLYLKRQSGYRNLANQRELEEHLLIENFQSISVENYSIYLQVLQLSRAHVIVAATGAALTNILWMPEGSNVVVLQSDHKSINIKFWGILCAALNINFYVLTGPRLGVVTGKYGVHDDFDIDINELKDLLLTLK